MLYGFKRINFYTVLWIAFVENIDKIIEIVHSDHHVSSISIPQKLNIVQNTVWNHFKKAEE